MRLHDLDLLKAIGGVPAQVSWLALEFETEHHHTTSTPTSSSPSPSHYCAAQRDGHIRSFQRDITVHPARQTHPKMSYLTSSLTTMTTFLRLAERPNTLHPWRHPLLLLHAIFREVRCHGGWRGVFLLLWRTTQSFKDQCSALGTVLSILSDLSSSSLSWRAARRRKGGSPCFRLEVERER